MPDPPLAHAVFELLRCGRLPEATEFGSTVSRRVELLTAGLKLVTGQSPTESAERQRAMVLAARRAHRPRRRRRAGAGRAALSSVVWRIAAAIPTPSRPGGDPRLAATAVLRLHAAARVRELVSGLYE
jgi:hypothetical protein